MYTLIDNIIMCAASYTLLNITHFSSYNDVNLNFYCFKCIIMQPTPYVLGVRVRYVMTNNIF